MAMAQFVTSNIAGRVRRPRPGPRGSINQGRSFNNFPAIIAAFPNELSAIVAQTTDDLGILARMHAPVQPGRPGARAVRRSDPPPSTLKESATTKVFYRRATDAVKTGRVMFTAKDRRGHLYAKPVETGSLRKSKRGLRRVEAHPFLVDAIVTMRPVFVDRIMHIETRLPR